MEEQVESCEGFLLDRNMNCFSIKDYFVRLTNFTLWISLFCITFLLVRKLAKLFKLWIKGSRIPGPPSPSFFAGHSKIISGFGSSTDLTGYLAELHEKYGPIVRLWLSPTQLFVSVKDVTVIKDMLVKAKDKVPLTGRTFRMAFGRSNFFISSFEKVQEGREYFAASVNERLLERVDKAPQMVVDCVIGRVESILSKGILNCRSISQHIAFYMLGATFFEEAFLNWSDATLYEELLLIVTKDACFWASYKIPPLWRRDYWRYRFLCTKLKNLTREIIHQCGYRGNKSMLLGKNSFLEQKNEHHISNKECGDILAVMFHGCLTITNLVCSILTRLVLYPELQLKILSEIKEVQQRERNQDSCDVQNMHFLLATVYESVRLLPPGPFLQRCSLNHDVHLKSSITVPAGSILAVPLQLVQTDNSIWGDDASEFNPYRFIPNNVDGEGISEEYGSSEPNKHAAYLPFGSGTRACIGQQFTILAVSTLFASLLQKYEVKLMPVSESKVKLTVNDGFQFLPSPKIVFVRRNN